MRPATDPLNANPLRPAGQSTSLSALVSATRQVTECSEYCHIIPGHPPLRDLSAFDAENSSKIKFRPAPRRWKWTHRALLRALIRGPCSDEMPLRDQKLDRLDRIRKNRRVLPQKFLDLVEVPSLDPRRCFAMADNIGCDEVVERIRLTAVPCVEETPDYGLVLLRRCAHGEVPSVIIPACIGTNAPMRRNHQSNTRPSPCRIGCGRRWLVRRSRRSDFWQRYDHNGSVATPAALRWMTLQPAGRSGSSSARARGVFDLNVGWGWAIRSPATRLRITSRSRSRDTRKSPFGL